MGKLDISAALLTNSSTVQYKKTSIELICSWCYQHTDTSDPILIRDKSCISMSKYSMCHVVWSIYIILLNSENSIVYPVHMPIISRGSNSLPSCVLCVRVCVCTCVHVCVCMCIRVCVCR